MLPLFFRRHSLRLLHRRHSHHYSTSQPLHLPLAHPIFQIWSANTSLGKTLVSAGLSSSFLLSSSSNKKFLYLKPVQTGFPADSDSRFLFTKLSALSLRRNFPFNLLLSDTVLKSSPSAAKSVLSEKFEVHGEKCRPGMCDLNFSAQSKIMSDKNGKDVICELDCKTLFAWKEAVSPHLAAERESGVVGDNEVVELLGKCLREGLESDRRERMEALCVVETAGGVASPGPSGSLQCDLYRQVIVRSAHSSLCSAKLSLLFLVLHILFIVEDDQKPFRLPGILVGDGRLGGISGTISAYESLKLRGYDVVAIVFEDHGLINEVPLISYLRNR
ncbi:hypothetical protein Pint_14194 [Pistacia integerrima]|uniref:Uncharacterized protein n=1 Tax=Pistacia integerrima TaxID=434235 RepID=A0ACC0Y7P6_9ROSI|nr:hypothetical protein Pint_14194 [Pistacia integerrima]